VAAVNDVPRVPRAPVVVMGPGTGLGAAQLMWDTGLGAYKARSLVAFVAHSCCQRDWA